MRKRIIVLLAIVTLLTYLGCGQKTTQKVTHEHEVKYYITMSTTQKNQIKAWNKAIEAHNNAYNKSTWNDEGTITGGRADSVQKIIKDLVATIDSSIKIISAMKEIDKDINLVERMTTYLAHSKKFWEVDMHQKIEYMRSPGLQKLSDIQEVEIESFDKDGDVARKEGDELKLYIEEFEEKHKITSDDLRSFEAKN